jgi:hypothetical protein
MNQLVVCLSEGLSDAPLSRFCIGSSPLAPLRKGWVRGCGDGNPWLYSPPTALTPALSQTSQATGSRGLNLNRSPSNEPRPTTSHCVMQSPERNHRRLVGQRRKHAHAGDSGCLGIPAATAA